MSKRENDSVREREKERERENVRGRQTDNHEASSFPPNKTLNQAAFFWKPENTRNALTHGYQELASPWMVTMCKHSGSLSHMAWQPPASAGSRRGHEEYSLTLKHMKHQRVELCLICSHSKPYKTRSTGICNPEHHLAQFKNLKWFSNSLPPIPPSTTWWFLSFGEPKANTGMLNIHCQRERFPSNNTDMNGAEVSFPNPLCDIRAICNIQGTGKEVSKKSGYASLPK